MQINQKSITPQFMSGLEAAQGIQNELNKFRYKSFYERHKAAASVVGGVGGILLGALSIGCAIMFVSDKIAIALGNFTVGALIASVILVTLEVAKSYALNGLFESFYYEKLHHKGGKVSVALLAGCVILIGLSAALSVFGAENYIMQSSDKSREITAAGFAKVDSARAVFDASIAALEATMQEINSGKAKRWGKLLTPAENQQILNIQARIAETEKAKQAAINEQKAGTSTAIQETKTAAMSSGTVGGLIAFFNEAAIIFCAWFVWFFAFKVANEEKLKAVGGLSSGTSTGNEDSNISIETLPNGALPNGEKSKGIGFTFGTKVAAPTVAGNNEAGKVAPTVAVPVNEAGKVEPTVAAPKTVNVPTVNVPTMNVPTVGNKACKHCTATFEAKHWNAQYCNDACRIASWELKTGKKFVAGKKR